MRSKIRFIRHGTLVELKDVQPDETVLDYLRLRERATGTKEGCGEGDCGACTVALGRLRAGALEYVPVNSCIYLLGMLDGKELISIEDLTTPGGGLHPVQQALVESHASQCGFCTPGFVMSLFTLYHQGEAPTRAVINDHLAGNLCRCTGYRPIVAAAQKVCTGHADDVFSEHRTKTGTRLTELSNEEDHLFVGTDRRFFSAPRTVDELARLRSRYPTAVLVAGATDVGLSITKRLETLDQVIHLEHVSGLNQLHEEETQIRIGASVDYTAAEHPLRSLDPDIGEVLRRLGATQVRSVATIGGNIANGSPIGDMPPILIALGATIILRKGPQVRELPLEAFFLAYGEQDLEEGEFIVEIRVPRLGDNQHFRCFKISKRFDQDISALLGAFRVRLKGNLVVVATIAFGGMAGTAKRATQTEAALQGVDLDDEPAWQNAREALAQDFQPIDDLRASNSYRLETAAQLLSKLRLELSTHGASISTRVIERAVRTA